MVRKFDPVLNINTGTISPRTSVTDENPVIYRRVDEETARAITSGKISAFDVIEAIDKIERNAPDFNWREYDKRRRAGEKALNVSQREMIPVSEVPNENGNDGENAEGVITLKELGIGVNDPKNGKRKPGRPPKSEEPGTTEDASKENQ